jgi:hypothetical protein
MSARQLENLWDITSMHNIAMYAREYCSRLDKSNSIYGEKLNRPTHAHQFPSHLQCHIPGNGGAV